jgi:aspartate 1-decarboxylase
MYVEVLQAKIHNVRITQTELNYTGSITIDMDLVDAAGMIPNQKVLIVNNNNGERFETYVIKGDRNSGMICLNGPAARRVAVGDVIIIIGYGFMDFEEAKNFKPSLVFPNEATNLID